VPVQPGKVFNRDLRFGAAVLIPLRAGRRRTEEQLRRSEDRFRLLAENLAHHAVCLLDASGNVARWNAACERLYGHRAEQIRGQPLGVFYTGEDIERGKPGRDLAAAAANGRFEEECWSARSDGSAFRARLVLAALRDAGGNTEGYCRVTHDLTEAQLALERAERAEAEVARLNAELAQRSAQLDAANRELESLTYAVSHDLRGPLRHINSFARLIMEESGERLSGDTMRHLDIIARSAVKLGRLIDDLLHFSRMSRLDLRREFVDLNRLAAQARNQFEDELASRRVEWQMADLPVVHADPALMRVVFTLLISNAVKFTRGRDPAVIAIDAQAQNGEIVIRIRDNGAGFDQLFGHKLFGAFQRLHHESEFEGIGMGLATVKRIIERHGGRVWAEGAVDAGASIYIALKKSA
jgi:PAS domain S-box-containing protein